MDLDPRFRFENYVVGSANRLAVSAARAVAQSPGAAYNPLFIYSSSGLGKTHLLLALGQLARRLQPDLRVEYVTLEEFVDDLTRAIAGGATAIDAFKQRQQAIGLLLLDDVQFLAGRRETQAEMLRVFNALQRSGRQIVLTSDRPPAEIADLDERLITRFSGGLVVDVGTPDYETRMAILRTKCDERTVGFGPGVLDELARLDVSNVRELQGALNRLIAHQALEETPVTPQVVRELFGESASDALRMRGTATGVLDAAGADGGEFASFLSDVAEVVTQQLDSWRARVGAAVTYWLQLGYATTSLERLLEGDADPGVDAQLAAYERAVERLRALAAEAAQIDPAAAHAPAFHDPDCIGEAELIVARLLGAADPPPGPSASLTRAGFEVGPSNQLAVHAADTVIEEPARKYNPLFIHGPAGVGKTHLLHAIGNDLVALSGGATTVACVTGQQFVDELIAAIREDTVERWRARYRLLDVLILDDVAVCAGKERTQEELFHIFNGLLGAGRQVILGAERPPRAIDGLEARLRSRFEGGLVVEIQPPDRLLRERLYARYLAAAGMRPDRALVEALADYAAPSVSAIIATVERLVQGATVARVSLTPTFARQELDGAVAPVLATPAPGVGGHPVDAFFLDREKIIWEWPDIAARAIEEWR